jgi:hypothetical protein
MRIGSQVFADEGHYGLPMLGAFDLLTHSVDAISAEWRSNSFLRSRVCGNSDVGVSHNTVLRDLRSRSAVRLHSQ